MKNSLYALALGTVAAGSTLVAMPANAIDFGFTFENAINGPGTVAGVIRGLDEGTEPATSVEVLSNTAGFGIGEYVGNPFRNSWTVLDGELVEFEFLSFGDDNSPLAVTDATLFLNSSELNGASFRAGINSSSGGIVVGNTSVTTEDINLTFTRLNDDILIGDPIRLSENFTSLNAVSPALIYNSVNKEYVAVWDFIGNDGRDLALQRFSSTGDLIEGNIQIKRDGNSNSPGLTYNSLENQYLLNFSDNLPGPNLGLFGQLFTADGTSVGENIFLSNALYEPSFLYNPNQNEYFKTGRRFSGENAIFSQRISSDGFPISPAIQIDSVGDSAPNGEVAFNNIDNQYLATWRNQQGVGADIVGRLISADGTFLSDQFNIVEDIELAFSINTVFDPINTQFLIAYGIPDLGDVKGQIVDADGTIIGDEIVIFDEGYNTRGNNFISVAFSQELGIYLLVASTNSGLLGQFIDDSGSLIDDPFGISPRNASFNSVVYNPDESQFAVAWNFNLSNQGIFAQLIDPPMTQPPSATVPEPTSILSLLVVGTVAGTALKRKQV